MKTKLVLAMLLAGSSMFAETHFSVGIGVGGYGHAAPPVVAYAPPCPGPGYTWVDGYWDGAGPRRFWRAGYWAAPTYRSEYRGNSYSRNSDGNRYAENRGDHNFNANRDQNRFDGYRNDNTRITGNSYTGNRPDQNRFGSGGNQFTNGFGRR